MISNYKRMALEDEERIEKIKARQLKDALEREFEETHKELRERQVKVLETTTELLNERIEILDRIDDVESQITKKEGCLNQKLCDCDKCCASRNEKVELEDFIKEK